LEISGNVLIEALSQHFYEGIERNHEKAQSGQWGISLEISTKNLLYRSIERYR
jgi:hypothetical protein